MQPLPEKNIDETPCSPPRSLLFISRAIIDIEAVNYKPRYKLTDDARIDFPIAQAGNYLTLPLCRYGAGRGGGGAGEQR